MDEEAIYAAYVARMKAIGLPAAPLDTYMKETSHIPNGFAQERQHKRSGVDRASSPEDRFSPLHGMLLLVVVLLASLCGAQVNVTAQLVDGSGSVTNTGFLHFELENCGNNFPVVDANPSLSQNPWTIVKTVFDLKPNQADGSIVGQVVGNDQIRCGNIRSTYYQVTAFKDANTPVSPLGGQPFVICTVSAPIGMPCSNPASSDWSPSLQQPSFQPVAPGFVQVFQNPLDSQEIDQPVGTRLTYRGVHDFCSATVLCSGGTGSPSLMVNGGPTLVFPVNFQNGLNTTASNPSGSNVEYDVPNATNSVPGVLELNTDLGGTATAPNVVNGSHITNHSIPSTGLANVISASSCTLCNLTFNAGGQITVAATGNPLINAGNFTNTQMNEVFQSLVGSCNSSTEFHYLFAGFATDGMAGCVTGSVGATVFEVNGVAGYSSTSSAPTASVGVLGLGRSLAAGTASATGGNFIGSDVAGFPNLGLYGVQADCNIFNAGSGCHGVLVGSFFAFQPSASVGYELQPPQGGAGAFIWGEGIRLDERASPPASNAGAGLDFFPTTSAVNSPSQGTLHISRDSGGGLNTVVASELANGNYAFVTSKAGTGVTVNGNIAGTTKNTTSGLYLSIRAQGGCTTAASIGGVCATSITVTWPGGGFPDTNYAVNCSANGAATNLPGAPYVVSKATGTALVNYFAISAAAASWPSIDCEAIHD